MKKNNLVLVLALGSLLPAGLASAQEQDKPPAEEKTPATDTTDAELEALLSEDDSNAGADNSAVEGEGEVINVTGTAIERKEVDTPAPITVLSKQDLESTGITTIGEILQQLPENGNAGNTQGSLAGDGTSTVNLRSLGSDRTLILINGRRTAYGGRGVSASVDLSSIPIGVIDRIEVLKDGASTIYGSDAIGGVVNIITRKEFNGLETTIQSGTSQRFDGWKWDMGVIGGMRRSWGGATVAFGYSEHTPIYARDRGWSETPYRYDFKNRTQIANLNPIGPNGYLETNDLNILPGGSGRYTFDRETGRPINFDATTHGFNSNDFMQLVTQRRLFSAYSEGDIKLGSRLKAFYEGSFVRRESSREIAAQPFSINNEKVNISGANAFNPFGRDVNFENEEYGRRFVEHGTRRFSDDNDTLRLVGGFEGDLPERISDTWRWKVSATFARSNTDSTSRGLFHLDRLREAVGPTTPDGSQCLTPDGAVIPGCVPLNIFATEGNLDPEALQYIDHVGTLTGHNQAWSIDASANGRIFKTPWDGDLRVAFGGTFRDEEGAENPDPESAAGKIAGNKTEPISGGFNVKEAFAELSFVPVTGRPGAKWVEANASARIFDYSNFGSDFTYKFGGLWKFGGGVSARGTYSTAFRAPSIGALYSATQTGFPESIDPCTPEKRATNPILDRNCTSHGVDPTFKDDKTQHLGFFGGNPDLKPETAKIWTVGAAYEPHFINNLGLTADFYHVRVTNSIDSLSAQALLNNCYLRESPTDCDKIVRGPTDTITEIRTNLDNIKDGGEKTAGIDLGLTYLHPLLSGALRHNLQGNYILLWKKTRGENVYDGVGVLEPNIGVLPQIKANYAIAWGIKNVGVGANVRYIHKWKECEGRDCADLPVQNMETGETTMQPALARTIPRYVTGDLYAAYRFDIGMGPSQLTLGVNNVLDKDPPVVYGLASSFNTDSDTYDFIGRYFYAKWTQSF